ncbi:hypothetical protein [Actinomycetospora sp. CA-084318]|uniref:hypothetical protein n=1 Tax=Actinomycetospora sp. CA-084318 TaxID=3239892 RepID=UPI003D96AE6B
MTGEDDQRRPTADSAAGAGAAYGTMPGLVVEPETLPDGRSITYFTAGDSRR